MKHLNIKISGKVQGVFFRATAKEQADRLGIKGFVRNEEDGSVYIECEAEEEQLSDFVSWCHNGPRHARVDKVEITEGSLSGFPNFKVQR